MTELMEMDDRDDAFLYFRVLSTSGYRFSRVPFFLYINQGAETKILTNSETTNYPGCAPNDLLKATIYGWIGFTLPNAVVNPPMHKLTVFG